MKEFIEFLKEETGKTIEEWTSFLRDVGQNVKNSKMWGGTEYNHSDVSKFLRVRKDGKSWLTMGNKEYAVNINLERNRISSEGINQLVNEKIFKPAVEAAAKKHGLKLKLVQDEYYYVWEVVGGLNESLIDTDQVETNDIASMLRGALADEASATNLYSKILGKLDTDEEKKVIEEIKNDEQQHSVLLTNLLMKIDPSFRKADEKAATEFPALASKHLETPFKDDKE